MGKLTISMAIFNSYVKLPEGIPCINIEYHFYDQWGRASKEEADRLINSAHLWDATWNPKKDLKTPLQQKLPWKFYQQKICQNYQIRSGTVRLVPKHAARTSSRCRRMARQRRSNAQMRAVWSDEALTNSVPLWQKATAWTAASCPKQVPGGNLCLEYLEWGKSLKYVCVRVCEGDYLAKN